MPGFGKLVQCRIREVGKKRDKNTSPDALVKVDDRRVITRGRRCEKPEDSLTILLEFILAMEEGERSRFGVRTPCDEPLPRGLDILWWFCNPEFEFHSSDEFDVTIVVCDGEAFRDDVVEVDHGASDNL